MKNSESRLNDIVVNFTALAAFIIVVKVCTILVPNSDGPYIVWLPAGVALGFLLLYGYEVIFGIFAAIFLSNYLIVNFPLALSLLFAASNSACYLLAAYVISNRCAGGKIYERFSYAMIFFATIVVTALLAGTFGAVAFYTFTHIQAVKIGDAALTWALGDLVGYIAIVPMVIAFKFSLFKMPSKRQLVEVAILAFLLVLFALFVSSGTSSFLTGKYLIAYLLFPPVFFAAIRFGFAEASLSLLITYLIVAVGIVGKYGVFDQQNDQATVWLLQSYIIVISLTALAFSAMINERDSYEANLRELNENLSSRIKTELEKSRQKDYIMFERSRHLALGELLVNIAHHWREPIGRVASKVLQLREDIKKNPSLIESFDLESDIILSELNELSKTIDYFTNIYEAEEANAEGKFSLKEAIHGAIDIIDASLKYASITVESTIAENFFVQGDKNDITRVFLNLFANTKDAAVAKKLNDVKVSIVAIYDQKLGAVKIRFSDNAGGVDEKYLEMMFDPYFMTKHRSRGTGLGLFIVKSLIEQKFNGVVRARNAHGGLEITIEVSCVSV